MTATLTFSLPDDREEYERATKATDLCAVLWHFEQYLRGCHRFDRGQEAQDLLGAIQKEFYDTMEHEGVDLDRLYT
jgi:hypothetical protein